MWPALCLPGVVLVTCVRCCLFRVFARDEICRPREPLVFLRDVSQRCGAGDRPPCWPAWGCRSPGEHRAAAGSEPRMAGSLGAGRASQLGAPCA